MKCGRCFRRIALVGSATDDPYYIQTYDAHGCKPLDYDKTKHWCCGVPGIHHHPDAPTLAEDDLGIKWAT